VAKNISIQNSKDKYGRSMATVVIDGTVEGVVVRMPKVFIEKMGKSQSYLSNRWNSDKIGDVENHATRKEAIARLTGEY
jgi:hypothetical protein